MKTHFRDSEKNKNKSKTKQKMDRISKLGPVVEESLNEVEN